MARTIKGTIYKLTYTANWHTFVECSSKEDLFRYIAEERVNGHIVTSVNEICKDGSTPKVKVYTDKEYKQILKQYKDKLSTLIGNSLLKVKLSKALMA